MRWGPNQWGGGLKAETRWGPNQWGGGQKWDEVLTNEEKAWGQTRSGPDQWGGGQRGDEGITNEVEARGQRGDEVLNNEEEARGQRGDEVLTNEEARGQRRDEVLTNEEARDENEVLSNEEEARGQRRDEVLTNLQLWGGQTPDTRWGPFQREHTQWCCEHQKLPAHGQPSPSDTSRWTWWHSAAICVSIYTLLSLSSPFWPWLLSATQSYCDSLAAEDHFHAQGNGSSDIG